MRYRYESNRPWGLLETSNLPLRSRFGTRQRDGLAAFIEPLRTCLPPVEKRLKCSSLDKKEWKDAWRPIYEALRAAEAGPGEYLKRVAVEIREPAMTILRRIAPELRLTSD